jgi:hypothetical protein
MVRSSGIGCTGSLVEWSENTVSGTGEDDIMASQLDVVLCLLEVHFLIKLRRSYLKNIYI